MPPFATSAGIHSFGRLLASPCSARNDTPGRTWRHAAGGGWVSYDLKVLPDQPVVRSCTWWGDEAGARRFDILVEGVRLATETLLHNKPGQFFDREYPIPADLTRGKQSVTVRLQARPGNFAGGLFGCAVLKAREAR